MKIRGTVAAALASAGILLAGWQTGTQAGGISTVASSTTATGTTGATGTGSAGTGSSGSAGSSSSSGATGSSGSASSSGSSSSGSSSSSSSSASGTYKGNTVQTRFGPVQVQITVANGKITDVTALQLTNTDGKSIQISNRAAPLLRSKVLAAQSANVQTVSGATITSDAYLTSLQAAIDAANL
ncbi:FMN-binding protein [Pseudarthrobacter phenanthrenivorans]|uniref:FMN-binding protein n=1 Tax=Pseudarthrobacter phenanthrenivorans TaxID=361575 RepID=A0A0B4D6R3_PSEPS|nr:FMN-binding protein [Pseudarthrobacter phenanthrenivorans]KIC69054.1 FMN-binding protein [Pseudarthrobacter phenanthrenivorans]